MVRTLKAGILEDCLLVIEEALETRRKNTVKAGKPWLQRQNAAGGFLMDLKRQHLENPVAE